MFILPFILLGCPADLTCVMYPHISLYLFLSFDFPLSSFVLLPSSPKSFSADLFHDKL